MTAPPWRRLSAVSGMVRKQGARTFSSCNVYGTVLWLGPSGVWARVYLQSSSRNRALARSVGEVGAKEGWKIEELHTEEGRLDEVFRSITLPDTVKEDTK